MKSRSGHRRYRYASSLNRYWARARQEQTGRRRQRQDGRVLLARYPRDQSQAKCRGRARYQSDRKSVVEGKRVSVRVALVASRNNNKKKKKTRQQNNQATK